MKKTGVLVLYYISKGMFYFVCFLFIVSVVFMVFDLPGRVKIGEKLSGTATFMGNAFPVMVKLNTLQDTLVSYKKRNGEITGSYLLKNSEKDAPLNKDFLNNRSNYLSDSTVGFFELNTSLKSNTYIVSNVEKGAIKEVEEIIANNRFELKDLVIQKASITVNAKDLSDRIVIAFPTWLKLVLLIFMQWLLAKFFLNIYNNKIFVEGNFVIMRKLGYVYIGFFLVSVLSSFLNKYFICDSAKLKLFHLNSKNWPFSLSEVQLQVDFFGDINLNWLYISLILFVVASIFKMGLNLKEDQDLTI